MASERSTRNRDLLSAAVSGILATLTSTSDNQTTWQLSSTNVVSETIGGAVEQRLQALFPQCGERSGLQQESNNSRGYLPRFDPRSNNSNAKKRKRNKGAKEHTFAKTIFLKDVVLLPSPLYKKVPRGKARETLYSEGYVSSAIEIHGDWSESEAVIALEKQFEEKLKDVPHPR